MNHDDDRDKSLCAAHGCPCKGTMSMSTAGSDKWYCGFHFGRDAVAWQRITDDLNRLHWLVGTIHDLRYAYTRDNWPEVARKAKHDLAMNNRNDLGPMPNESGIDWIKRLDSELVNTIGRAPRPEQRQPGLVGVTGADTFSRVAMAVPGYV